MGYFFLPFFAHLALAALLATVLRSSAVMVSILRLPPILRFCAWRRTLPRDESGEGEQPALIAAQPPVGAKALPLATNRRNHRGSHRRVRSRTSGNIGEGSGSHTRHSCRRPALDSQSAALHGIHRKRVSAERCWPKRAGFPWRDHRAVLERQRSSLKRREV